MFKTECLTDVHNYMLDINTILHIKTYQFEDYSFEGLGGDTITIMEMQLINLSTGEMKEIKHDYSTMKALYNDYNKHLHWKYAPPGFMTGKELYALYRPLIPYEELSAIQQKNDDLRNGDYPNPYSKYFGKVTQEEIETLLEQAYMDLGQNINDATMYNDIPYRERSSYRKDMRKINYLKETLTFAKNR